MGDHRHVRDARRDLACARGPRTPGDRGAPRTGLRERTDACGGARAADQARPLPPQPARVGGGRSSQRGSRVLSSRRRNAAVGGRAGGTAARDRDGAGRRHADRGVGAADLLPQRASDRDPREAIETTDGVGTDRTRVRTGTPLRREGGQRHGRPILHRSRGAPPGAGRRRVPRPRPRGILAGGRWGGPRLKVSAKATGASRRGPVLIGSASVQGRLRNVLLVTVLAVSTPMLLPSPAAAGRHPHHPCQLTRRDGETVQHFSERQITCAVGAYGPVKGGITRAICIARRESGLIPSASSPKGRYLGLYQHSATYWPWRFDTYTQPSWSLSTSALSARSNAIVTVRMVHSLGGWRHAGWPVKAC